MSEPAMGGDHAGGAVMDLVQLARATRLAQELKNLRQSVQYLKEDSKVVVDVKVEDLTMTYGSDRRRVVFPYAKTRLLDVLAAEEARLVTDLTDLGVSTAPPTEPGREA